jgi:hypothetical protein
VSNKTSELRHRVEARKKELEASLERAKADAQGEASETVDRIQAKLRELDDHLREGWDNLSEAVADRINEWLK